VGALSFLLVQLTAWPPHEDETLALFVGRQSLPHLFHTVLGQRGGAPLHFLLAWLVTHTGGGLTSLRLVSALFATASIPVVGLLGARLASRGVALAATALVSASWVLLFHGIYARMYSLFLFTSALSYLALIVAVDRGGRRRWTLWALAAFAMAASHPYAAIVLASQGFYVLLVRKRIVQALWAFGAVGVVGIPLWRSDLVLAGRFDVGVGGGGNKLGTPRSVFDYLRDAAGDFLAGYRPALIAVLALAALGLAILARRRPQSALLVVAVLVTPTAALLLARLGSSTSPETRHLIFVLPFFALLVAMGLVEATRLVPKVGPLLAIGAVAAILPAEIAWGYRLTPELYRGEPAVRILARHDAAAWLASVSEPNDVLFGYSPLYDQAWERARGRVSDVVVPRADPRLAFSVLLHAPKPLGHGIWVFDASATTNGVRHLGIPLQAPLYSWEFDTRLYGPFVIVRSREPAVTVGRYLKLSRMVEEMGIPTPEHGGLAIGDALTNLKTAAYAEVRLDRYAGTSRSRSTVSR